MKKVWLIALLFILLDQVSKFYIKLNFEYGEIHEIFSWFRLQFIENPGMAYGVELGGYTGKIILTILRFFLISYGIYYLYQKIKPTTTIYLKVPIALILAGAIGNLIDSMFYGMIFNHGLVWNGNDFIYSAGDYSVKAVANFNGYSNFLGGCVVDMLHFPLFTISLPEWLPFGKGVNNEFTFFNPIFNVADSCISVGIFLLFIFRKKAMPEGIKL